MMKKTEIKRSGILNPLGSPKKPGKRNRLVFPLLLAPLFTAGAGYAWFKTHVFTRTPHVAQKMGDLAEGSPHKATDLLECARVDHLISHVETLCGFFPRAWNHPENLNKAANFIGAQWQSMGYAVKEHVFEVSQNLSESLFPMQTFDRSFGVLKPIRIQSGPPVGTRYRNLWIDVPAKPTSPYAESPPILIGAHYDAIAISPGADDNASGVAGLLELSRLLRELAPNVPLRLVAWTNEEYPFGTTPLSGSMQHAMALKREKQKIKGVLSLEMIGRYYEEEGTQTFPFPIKYLRRQFSKGNFLTLFSSYPNKRFLELTDRNLLNVLKLPLHAAAMGGNSGWDNDLLRSDHWSYIAHGFSGVALSDGAHLRKAQGDIQSTYHTPEDLPSTLNYRGMGLAVDGLLYMFSHWHE